MEIIRLLDRSSSKDKIAIIVLNLPEKGDLLHFKAIAEYQKLFFYNNVGKHKADTEKPNYSRLETLIQQSSIQDNHVSAQLTEFNNMTH